MKFAAGVLSLVAAATAADTVVFVAPFSPADGSFGLAAANSACESAGGAGYAALLATSSQNLNTLVTGDTVKRVDGTVIATKTEFFGGSGFSLQNSITDFSGSAFGGLVLTGSDTAGAAVNTCLDWSSASGSDRGDWGGNFPNNGQWLLFGNNECNAMITTGVYCYENVVASSGNLDPHFFGFNGEKIDIEHDESAADRAFSVFCTEDIEVNTLFSATVDGLLYMTEFWIRVNDVKLYLALNKAPTVVSGDYEKTFVPALNRTRLSFDDEVVVEYDAQKTTINFMTLKINIASAVLANDEFLNFDIISTSYERFPAGGIVGRTMMGRVAEAEFAQYEQYEQPQADEYFNQKCVL